MSRWFRGRNARLLTILVMLGLVLSSAWLDKALSTSRSATATRVRGLEDESFSRHKNQQEFLDSHKDASGAVRADLWRTGIDQARQMKIAAGIPVSSRSKDTEGGMAPESGITGVQWTQIGPAPLRIDNDQNYQGAGPDSGEVLDFAIDPRNTTDQVIYIATNDGGIWKSTNGGSSWAPKTDYMPSLSMGAVALDPGNPSIVYAGTGNLFDGGGVFFKGVGIYKSIDAGETWSIIGANILNNVGVNRIVFPSANTLLVATNNGLFRSVDGGANFGNNPPAFNNNSPIIGGFITDLDLDTASASTVYASVNGTGIRVSTDSGVTFTNNLFSNPGAPAAPYAFIAFAQSTAPNNQTMYASVQDNPFKGLYKSTDGGANWAIMADAGNRAAENGGCQCGYDQTIAVDPQDANRVYMGFQELYLSTDGATTFGTPAISRDDIHWDHHAIGFSPQSHWTGGAPTRLWVGTDGGIHSTIDGGANWQNLNEGIATNIFFSIDIGRGSATNREYTYGGTQDTGTIERRPEFAGNDWHLGIDGDGGQIAVDRNNPLRAYGTDNGSYMVTSDGGDSWSFPGGTGLPGGVGFLGIDPNNSTIVYATQAAQLYQSTDTGATFTSIKTFPQNISSIANVDIDSNVFWVGLNNGTVQRTANVLAGASSTWTALTVAGAPAQRARGIAIDPTNTDVAVVVYPGFSNVVPANNRQKHAFRTTDAGATWTDISGTDGGDITQNLPDLPLHSVVIDPGHSPHMIIVSSDAGVMRTVNNGATWQVLGLGLPTVYSRKLAIDTSVTPSLLRIGTYGRSVFELTAATGPLLGVNANLAFGTVAVGSSDTRIVQMFNVGSSDLHISSFDRVAGSNEFQVISGPALPVTIPPGGQLDFTVRFAPTSGGNKTATFQINSDDPFQPMRQLFASGTGGLPLIEISGDLNFGTVARGTQATRDITVYNLGSAPLIISSVSLVGAAPDFSIVNPTVPQTIEPGSHYAFTIRFAPPAGSSGGPRTGTFRIVSNDATNSPLNVPMNGIVGVPNVVIGAGSLNFGAVAVDDRTFPNHSDQVLTISNQASCELCDLRVTALPISGPNAGDFSVVNPPALPVIVAAGDHLDLTVRFNPIDGGNRTATLTVTSDDPVQPNIAVALSGTGLMPFILTSPNPMIFGPTVYSPVCDPLCGQVMTQTITNNGLAELILDVLSFSGSPAFSGPGPTVPVTRVQPSQSFLEPVTFNPSGGPARKLTGNLHIQDNVVSGPVVQADVPLCGESVGRGIRVLAYDTNGNIIPSVSRLQLQSHGLTNPVNINLKKLDLVTINPPDSCQIIKFHYENMELQATEVEGNRGSYYILTVVNGNKRGVVSFTLEVNEFKIINVTLQ